VYYDRSRSRSDRPFGRKCKCKQKHRAAREPCRVNEITRLRNVGRFARKSNILLETRRFGRSIFRSRDASDLVVPPRFRRSLRSDQNVKSKRRVSPSRIAVTRASDNRSCRSNRSAYRVPWKGRALAQRSPRVTTESRLHFLHARYRQRASEHHECAALRQ